MLLPHGMEMSGTSSCPEIARLALLNKDKMEFTYMNEEELDYRLSFNFNKQDKITKYYWDIRVMIITILQNTNYTIQNRLTI